MLVDASKIVVKLFSHLLVVNGQVPCQEVGGEAEHNTQGEEHQLLLQETWVWVPVPITGNSPCL